MIYKWELKNTGTGFVIQKGNIEADVEVEAIRMLNEDMGIQPHVGEILEIIAPDDMT